MMLSRVTYFLFTFIILGCAEDSINQITKKDSIEIKTVDSNDSDRVTTQVEKEGLKIPEAAVPKVVLKKKTLTSPKVWRHSNEPKNSTEDDDKLVLEPVPVVEELVEFEVPPSVSPKSAEKTIELLYPSKSSEPSSPRSNKNTRLHQGMPALNLWYLR